MQIEICYGDIYEYATYNSACYLAILLEYLIRIDKRGNTCNFNHYTISFKFMFKLIFHALVTSTGY